MAEVNLESDLPVTRDASNLEKIIQAENEAEQSKHHPDNTFTPTPNANQGLSSPSNLLSLFYPQETNAQDNPEQNPDDLSPTNPNIKLNRLASMTEEQYITKNLSAIANNLPENFEIITEDPELQPAVPKENSTKPLTPRKSDSTSPKATTSEPTSKDESEIERPLELRIEEAEFIKNSAKSFVSKGFHEDAIKIYEAAFKALRITHKDHRDSNFSKALHLQNILFTNLALCHSNLGLHDYAVRYCDRVLQIEKYNSKALYRKALSLKHLGKSREAYDSLKSCIEAFKQQNPSEEMDSAVVKLYLELREICKEEIEREKKEDKERYAKMMNQSPRKPKEEEKAVETPQDLTEKSKRVDFLAAVNAVIIGFVASEYLKGKGVTGLESSAVGLATGAGLYTGVTTTKKSWLKIALGALPLAAFAGYQLFKKK